MNKYIETTKFSEKTCSINAIKFINFQRKLKKYAKLCLDETTRLFVIHYSSIRHYKKLLKMKTTKNTGEIQKIRRKVLKESVQVIETSSFSLQTLCMIQWTSALS